MGSSPTPPAPKQPKPDGCGTPDRKPLSGRDILASDFVGVWKDRADVAEMGTDAFARRLRERAGTRVSDKS